MAHTLQLEHQLKGNVLQVYPSVLDMRHFGKHHPYMKEVSLIQETSEFCEYQIKEFIWLFGFLPQWPVYTAKVFEREKHKHVQYTSLVKGAIDLKIDFHFADASPSVTKITENIHLTGNAFVSRILLNTMHKAHIELFRQLDRSM